jgi:hypothetical protein
MKELVVILTHADTDERIQYLESCVNTMINQNKKILISSHIDIPNHLYSKVDYVIIDKENPILNEEVAPIFINHHYQEYRQTFTINFNHSFAVHKLILNACLMAQLNDFDIIHFINYDYLISDNSILEIHSNLLLENDLVSYDLTGNGTQHQLRMLSSAFFSINTKIVNDTLLKIRTKNDFINFGIFIYEQFLYNIFEDYRIGFLDINILKNCSINKVSTLSDYSFEVEDGTSIWCGISQQADEIFLYIRSNYSRNVTINGLSFTTDIEVNLFAITEDILKKEIKINFVDLGIIKIHNINSRRAECAVFDRNIIRKDLINKKYSIEKYEASPVKRFDIINFLHTKFNFSRYLEIGVNDGFCIRQINIPHKDGIDPSPECGFVTNEINYNITSDDFFESHAKEKYDLIFIDGLHHSEQVDKDIENSLNWLNEGGFIILHDCNPPEYELQLVPRVTMYWNGDVWKSIVKARKNPELEVSVIDTDWGVGVIKKANQRPIEYDLELCLDWNFFDKNREEILNIVSVDEFYANYK